MISNRPIPGPLPVPVRSTPAPIAEPADTAVESGHPVVDAVIQAVINAADLPPADQIAQYEAALNSLRETLATIDQS